MKLQTNDRVVVSEQSGDITFHNLTKEDFGVYYCVAENKHGSSVSSFVKILEAGKNLFWNRLQLFAKQQICFSLMSINAWCVLFTKYIKLSLKPFIGLVETHLKILHVRYSITARFLVPTSRVVNQSMNVHLNGKVEKE